jgi:hypothetical protein
MKQTTLKKYINILTDIKCSGMNIKNYCILNNISYQNIYAVVKKLKEVNDEEDEMVDQLLSLYNEICHPNKVVEDTDDRAEISYLRDEDGRIQYYQYQIYRRNKRPISGKLTREEMSQIHRLYSYYGDSLTQRVVSRYFTDLSLVDFKRILRAFNITKASAPFAPHDIEERTEDELREIQLREKENSFLRKAEEDLIKNNEKLLKKYAQENIELKKQLKDISNFNIKFEGDITPIKFDREPLDTDAVLNLYLSDIHLGSYTTFGSLYDENREYGFEEAKRRLSKVLESVYDLGIFNTINVVLLGDNIDCCGITGKTARLDHTMPSNMDAKEQANKFIELMDWFLNSLYTSEVCNSIKLYSVPEGNHAGNYEYVLNKALMSYVNVRFPSIETTLWDKYYGIFEVNNNVFLCFHGKDGLYAKKGMPLNLDDKSKTMLYEWLMKEGITSDKIHFIKGDLHSNALSSCARFDYRNVLSLYGASDYSNMNFSRNSYGVSYDLIIGEQVLKGTFENM